MLNSLNVRESIFLRSLHKTTRQDIGIYMDTCVYVCEDERKVTHSRCTTRITKRSWSNNLLTVIVLVSYVYNNNNNNNSYEFFVFSGERKENERFAFFLFITGVCVCVWCYVIQRGKNCILRLFSFIAI